MLYTCLTRSYHQLKARRLRQLCLLCCCLLLGSASARAQGTAITINLGAVDGLSLTPDNIFNYQIQSTATIATQVTVHGQVRFRAHPELAFGYTFPYTIRQGTNQLGAAQVHPQWTFTSGAMRDLFLNYKKLPEGTYEYCVSLSTANGSNETGTADYQECLFGKEDDLFLINLIAPEDGAKITEYNPMLSWVVNYPFASELSYKLRLVEIKDGQNTVAAVTRNNPIYAEGNLTQTAQSYPVYAKALQPWQPYGWTVDAYFKGILLGGAQPWKFTIVVDSILNALPQNQSYYEFATHHGENSIYAIGKLKLKYVNAVDSNALSFRISETAAQIKSIKMGAGDNRIDLELTGKSLKHLNGYTLEITDKQGGKYLVPFIYFNPDFLK